MGDRFYFRQLLSGRDLGQGDALAHQMVNFIYLIGDRESGEAVVVDPAYDIASINNILESDGMKLTGALVTHYHPDHVGGSMMGYNIEGVAQLLAEQSVPIHVQEPESAGIQKVTGVSQADLVEHVSGDTVMVGEIPITLIHTPGHTPGSQCFLVNNMLVSGDTLFLEGCGRTDLPGGDSSELYYSLTQRLAKVPDTATLYPGHQYSAEPHATMAHTRANNFVFRPASLEQWLMMFGN